jgi:hypothetical protein
MSEFENEGSAAADDQGDGEHGIRNDVVVKIGLVGDAQVFDI